MIDFRRALMLSASLALAVLAARAEAGQVACSFDEEPVLDFGQPAANPTLRSESSTTVRVSCVGDDDSAGELIQVCLLAPPGGQTTMRRGASGLHYALYADSAHTRPLAHPSSAVSVGIRLGDRGNVSGEAKLPVHGAIHAGQSGLAGGLHSDRVPLQVRVASGNGEDCTTAPTRATGMLEISAQLASGSCTVHANDLDFGRAYDLARGIEGRTALGLTCTAGTPYSVALSGGTVGQQVHQRRMGAGGAPGGATVQYQLYQDAAHARVWGEASAERVAGTGTGTPQTLPVHARVPAQPTPPAGQYRDVVTATVEF